MAFSYSAASKEPVFKSGFLILSALFCVAFLSAETFRAELWAFFGGVENYGRQAFVVFRLILLVASGALAYFSLPRSDALVSRAVPLPVPGYDPLLTLRAFACLLVILGHGLAVVFVPTPTEGRQSAWLLMGSPWAGVWMFFVLSGYLMGKGFYGGRYNLSQIQIRRFYRNRLQRIVPTYYAALFLVALLVTPQLFSMNYLWELMALAVFSQQNMAPTPVIGALWSVQTEMAFYAMVPLFFFLVSRAVRVVHPLAVIVLLLGLGFAYRYEALVLTATAGWVDRALVPLSANLDLFLAGMAANWFVPIFNKATAKLPSLALGLLLILATYVAGAYMFSRAVIPSLRMGHYMNDIIFCGPTFIATVTLLIIFLFESFIASGRKGGVPSLRIVRYTQLAGVITYSLYVWHEPIFLHQRAAMPAEISMGHALVRLAVAITLSAIVAYASYRIIEAPFERKKVAMPPEAHAA